MKRHMPKVMLLALMLVAGCSNSVSGLFGTLSTGPQNTVDVTQLPSMRVVGLIVSVPRTLVVSESNLYKPRGDIVWRGDPFGDRYQQVQTIFEDAISTGVASMNGDLPVVVHIEVRRFHGVTQKTRYTIGGVHEITFLLEVTNGPTGEVIIPAYVVNANLPAFGGDQALAAERVGLTQKVRIAEHLAAVIRQELTGIPADNLASTPGGETLEFGEELGDELTPFIRP